MNYLKKLFVIGVVFVSATNSFALKVEYRFEDSSGKPTTQNNQLLKLDGNLSGDAKIVDSGKIKNGLSISGNGGMSVKHDNALDIIDNLTITFWIYPNEYKREALIVKGNGVGDKYGANAEYSLVLWEDGKLKYKHNGTADTFSKSKIALNKWTHIALVRDNINKTIKIYINGKLDENSSYTIDPSSSNSEKLLIGIGKYYSSTVSDFNGKLDEIKIYGSAFSGNDIKDIYTIESSGTYYSGEFKSHVAPEAFNDSEELGDRGTVTIDVLANDIVYGSCELDKSTLKIVSRPAGGIFLDDNNKSLMVSEEGTWSVLSSGEIKFISKSDFDGNPTDIYYIVEDSCGGVSNRSKISLSRVIKTTESNSTETIESNSTETSGSTSTDTVIVANPTPTSTPATATPTTTPTSTSSASTTIEDNKTFRIGDRVWYDKNKNGIQDENEDGVKGVIVVLYNSNGDAIKNTTTDASGIYGFNNISAGKYSIRFSHLPSGYIFTKQNIGTNDAIDSDVNSAGRVTIDVTKDNLTYDAGIISTGKGVSSGVSGNIDTDCDCKDYKSTPSLTILGTTILFLLFSIFGAMFIKEEDFKLTIK